MTPEQIEAATAVATLLGGLITWLCKTASSVAKAHVTLGILNSDLTALKQESQQLRDAHIRTDTLIGTMSAKLDKLDQVDRLASNVEVMRSIVERLDSQVVPRPELEARLKGLEEKR
jgi:hypothetical protein